MVMDHNLTGIDATALKDSGGNVKIQAQASGAVHTGFSFDNAESKNIHRYCYFWIKFNNDW